MHSIASQKTFLSNAIKPTYGRDRIKFKPIHAGIHHMQYHSFHRLLISGINSQLQFWMLMMLKHLKIQYLNSTETSTNFI